MTTNPEGELLEEIRRLILQVEHLTGQVAALGEHVRISKHTTEAATRATERARSLSRVAVATTILCLLLSGGVLYLFRESHTNAVTACRNANESRAGNLAAWQFLIDASANNHPDQTPAQKALTARFQRWINTLYAPHDCGDLSKNYPIPAPPKIT